MKAYTVIILMLLAFAGMGFHYSYSCEWKAPESADQIKNPLKGDQKAVAAGETLFMQQCAVCHGNKGKGNGVAGASLNPKPANFWKDCVQQQSDGALYWKLNEGRGPMPSFSHLTEEQKWELVHFIRTFKK